MVWTSPMTFVDGRPLTSAQLNTQVRDNMLETEVAKASTAGGWFVAQAPHSIILRKPRKAFVDTAEDVTETDYTDLTTTGPKVTCQTGTTAICMVGARTDNSASNSVFMSVEVQGATSLEASDARALAGPGGGDSLTTMSTFWVYENDLTPGENTFLCKYRTNAGTGNFARRRLIVIPL